jgi:hypothetical protein
MRNEEVPEPLAYHPVAATRNGPDPADEERAAALPFKGTIAHGFLTLSLLAVMGYQACPYVEGARFPLNCGFNRVRFVAPVPVGVVAVLVAVPLVRLAAVAARASPASRSGRSVKSLKCGRRQASAVCKFPVVMVRPSSGFARVPRSVISRRKSK